jgi:serine/threonine-protein kinase
MGTPAFMPPEQADGDVELMDERADVFALGAILCVLLTGQPPYPQADAREALRRARRADLAEALGRLEGCRADAKLLVLCRACLTPEREGRPCNAMLVAERVAMYQAGVQERLRKAELERAQAQVKADEERKRRRLVMALATGVLLLVLVGGGGAWLQQQRSTVFTRQRENGQRVVLGLERARARLKEGWEANDLARLTEARAEADQAAADARAGEAEEAVRQEATALQKEIQERLARARKNDELRIALLSISPPRDSPNPSSADTGRGLALVGRSVDRQYADAFQDWDPNLDIDRAPEAEVVARLREEPEPMVQEILAALDGWMLERRRQECPEPEWRRLVRLTGQLDPEERRRGLRALLHEGPQPREEVVAGLTAVLLPWTGLCELEHGKHWRHLAELRHRMDPATEPVPGVVLLARACSARGDALGAEQVLRQALAARPNEVVLLDALGKLLEGQGPPRLAEAIECYRAARALEPRLGIALGRALVTVGRAAEGEVVLRDLIRRQPHNPSPHIHLGIALLERGKIPAALAAFQTAAGLLQQAGKK